MNKSLFASVGMIALLLGTTPLSAEAAPNDTAKDKAATNDSSSAGASDTVANDNTSASAGNSDTANASDTARDAHHVKSKARQHASSRSSRRQEADPNALGSNAANSDEMASRPNSGANWEEEDRYWRQNYSSRPYYNQDDDYSQYQPAYRYGTQAYNQYGGRRYEDINESDLSQGWEKFKDTSKLSWDRAKEAVKDAYNRVFNREKNTQASNESVDPNRMNRNIRRSDASEASPRAIRTGGNDQARIRSQAPSRDNAATNNGVHGNW